MYIYIYSYTNIYIHIYINTSTSILYNLESRAVESRTMSSSARTGSVGTDLFASRLDF